MLFRIFVLLTVSGTSALLSQRPSTKPIPAAPQRPSFSTDTTIIAPGTFEVEFGILAFSQNTLLPTTLKFTPPDDLELFEETEFSVSFDSIDRSARSGGSETRFSDSIDLAVRRPIYRGDYLSLALAPRIEIFRRGNDGVRLGGGVQFVYAAGLNGFVLNLIGTAATHPSNSNPGSQIDLIQGYSRTLAHRGVASRLSAFIEFIEQFPDGHSTAVASIQGLSYRLRPDLVLDFAIEQRGLAAGEFDVAFHGGLTYNLGRLWNQR